MLRTWFADEDTTDAQLKVAARKLLAGFKKIANVCNSNHLTFSDEPIDRSGGGWKDDAFVDPTETLNVVYAQGAFLRAAGSTGRDSLLVALDFDQAGSRLIAENDRGRRFALDPFSRQVTRL